MLLRMTLLGTTGIVLAVATAATAALQPPPPGEARQAFERLDKNEDGVLDQAEFGERLKRFQKKAQKGRRMGPDGPKGKRAGREARNQPREDGQGMGRHLRAMVTRIVKQELRKQRPGMGSGMGQGMGRDAGWNMRHPPRKGAQWAGKHQGDRKAGRRGFAKKGPQADRGARREFGQRGQRGPHGQRGNQFACPMGFDRPDRQGRQCRQDRQGWQGRQGRQDRQGWQDRQGRRGHGQKGPAFAPPEGHRKDVKHARRMMKHGPKGQRADRAGRGDRVGRGDRADRGGENGMRQGRRHAGERGSRDGLMSRMDGNRDGTITPDEFQADPRKLKRMFFRLFDLDGDGVIDRKEAERLTKRPRGGSEGDRPGRR